MRLNSSIKPIQKIKGVKKQSYKDPIYVHWLLASSIKALCATGSAEEAKQTILTKSTAKTLTPQASRNEL